MDKNVQNTEKVFWINIFSLLVALHYAVIVYAGSTFLSGILGESNIWLVYSLAAVSTIYLNFSVTKLIRRYNIIKVTRIALFIAIINMLNLFINPSNVSSFLSYILYITLAEFLFLLSSIMLEDVTRNSVTGTNRGHYISIQSIGYLLAPFLGAFFIKYFSISSIFLLSGIFGIIAAFIFTNTITNLPKINPHNQNVFPAIKLIFRKIDLRNIVIAQIGLYIFYAVLIIYIPFKLTSLGISLTQYLGVLLPIALTPFLFVPRIVGYVEDKMKNEKEFLIFGYFGVIFTLLVISFTVSNSLLVWAAILFSARFFASIVETSISSYFFKKVEQADTEIISIFSSAANVVYLCFTPIFATIEKVTDINILFMSVSFFLCFVLVLVSKIHNTKNYEEHKTWKEIWSKSKQRTERGTAF